ncbi:DUF3696 domain-containing protein [Formosa sediminum]|nr:DUF3696 domain-containing protein [Formosa sediminum]
MKINISNFRGYKENIEFDLRPISLLIGANNSGKSSFTKLLRLFKNGIERLNFSEGNHNLSSYESVLNKNVDSKQMKVKVSGAISFLNEETTQVLVYTNEPFNKGYEEESYPEAYLESYKTYYKNEVLVQKIKTTIVETQLNNNEEFEVESDSFLYSVNLELLIQILYNQDISIPKKVTLFDFNLKSNVFINATSLSQLSHENYTIEPFDKKHSTKQLEELDKIRLYGDVPELNLKNNDSFLLFLLALKNELNFIEKDYLLYDVFSNGKNITQHTSDVIKEVQFKNRYVTNLSELKILTENIKKELEEVLSPIYGLIVIKENALGNIIFNLKLPAQFQFSNAITTFFGSLINYEDQLNALFKKVEYLSPVNKKHNRISFSENSFELDQLLYKFLKGKNNNSNKLNLNDLREDFIRKSLNIFGIKGEFQTELLHNKYIIPKIVEGNKNLYLDELGLGISQILTIVLFLFAFEDDSYKDRILIIEEPETNLHPNFQSKLADVLAMYLRYIPTNNGSIIIETHSEYLVRKLQFLVASKDVEMTTEDVMIHYVNSDDNVSVIEPKVKQIEINENGGLTDTFGPGFYDEATNLQFQLIQLNNAQSN